MDDNRAPVVFEIDGIKTLPLYVIWAKTLEPIHQYSSGKAQIGYRNPDYEIPMYAADDETLSRLGSDSRFAKALVQKWHHHLTNFMCFVQFSDERTKERCAALNAHTKLISILCDTRLNIDPTPLWQVFDWSLTFQSIHASYRKDLANWSQYAERLEKCYEKQATDIRDAIRFLDRLTTQIELKEGAWSSMPPIAKKSPKPSKNDIEVFYSYCHKDEPLRDQLENHLSALKRKGVISGWHDRSISGGTEWEGQIDEHLESAGIILLLVSSDFLASNYCFDIEMTRAIARHDAGEARVIPVILRACDWTDTPFSKLQAFPKDGKAVTSWPNVDEAFTDVAKGIRKVAGELAGK